MSHKLFLIAAAGLLLHSATGIEKTSAASFCPPFQQEKQKSVKKNAKPYMDVKNSAFVFGNKRIVFSGPGNFSLFDGERKIAEQYIVFSSPFANWISSLNRKTEIVNPDRWDGLPVCISERKFDAAADSFVMKGFYPAHAKDKEKKLNSWSQTAKIRPDGKLEIVFMNHADNAYMQSRPRHVLNSFFFNLVPGITFETSQPRIKEKGLKKSWMYYSFKLLFGKDAICQVSVDVPSLYHPYKDNTGFYYNSPDCKEQRFIFDFLDYGEASKPAPGGVDFKAADDLILPYGDCRNLLPNPYFAEGRKYIMDGGHACFPIGYAGKALVTDPVLFGRYALAAGNYRFASVPSDSGTYTISFYLKGKGKFSVAIETKNPHVFAMSKYKSYDTQGKWKRFQFTYNYKGPGFQQPSISFNGGILDGIQLEKGSKASEFDASAVSGYMKAAAKGGNGFFESGKPQKITFELSTLKNRFQGDISFTVRNFYREVVLKQNIKADFKKGEYPEIALNVPAGGFPDGLYTIEMCAGKSVTFYRFSVMPYLKNTHATAKIFSPSYSGHKGYVDQCPDYYLQRLQHVGYGSMGHLPLFAPAILDKMDKYKILPFDSGCILRRPADRYKKLFPELADKLQTGHVYFGVYDPTCPSWEMGPKNGLLADYRLLGGWNAEYKRKFQDAVKRVLKKLPRRFAYGIGGEMPEEIKNDPHYIDLVLAYFEAVKSVYPDAHPYEGGAANMQIRNGLAEMERYLTRMGKRWPISLVVCHPYNGAPTEFHDQYMTLIEMLKKHDLDKALIAFPEMMHYYPYGASLWECNPISAEKNCVRTSMSYDLGWTERMSAAYYARCYLTVMTQFQRMYCVTTAVTTTRNDHLDVDMTSRASEKTINTLGVLLGNPRKYLGDCSFAPKVRCFVWETEDGTPLAAVWSDDKQLAGGYSVFPDVKLDYAGAEFTDLMGVKRIAGKNAAFKLTPFPLFIRGRKGDEKNFMEALKYAEVSGMKQFPCAMEPSFSGNGSIIFTFRNDQARKIEGTFSVNGQNCQLFIPSRGKQTVNVNLSEKLVPGKMHKIDLPWTFRSNGKIFNGIFKEHVLMIPRFHGDWNKIPAMSMPCYHKGNTPEKCGYPGDFEANMQIAWTSDALCLKVNVTDDILTAGSEPKCRYNYDVCQLFIDTRCSARKTGINVFDDDDYDYELMPTKDGKQCQVWRNLSPFIQLTLGTAAPKDKQLASEIPATFKRTAKGYVYEVRIPKAFVLPIQLTSGWNFALGIYVADRDTGKSVKQARFLGIDPKGGCWNKPLNWPVAVLAE